MIFPKKGENFQKTVIFGTFFKIRDLKLQVNDDEDFEEEAELDEPEVVRQEMPRRTRYVYSSLFMGNICKVRVF